MTRLYSALRIDGTHWSMILCGVISALIMASAMAACDDSDSTPPLSSVSSSAPLTLSVVIPEMTDVDERSSAMYTALRYAADDLMSACAQISGATLERARSDEREVRVVISAAVDEARVGDQGYQLQSTPEGVVVRARTVIGAAYGLYHLAQDLGARYIHPEESHFPLNPEVRLPTYDAEDHQPHFRRRGFHEHTQHPIVMSEYLLRPEVEGYREGVSRYLRWMLRSRQNSLTFHMLNTIDLEVWLPYLTSITTEAAELGVEVGFVTGFVDQQQNAFRLVMPDDPRSPEQQIIEKLDQFAAAGISLIGFQIGTSEFTKPDEAEILGWINLAVSHLAMSRPDLEVYAWIHITCGLELEAGGSFYHLPLQADERLGAFVHTTMFYTIDHPAPVYDCEDFTHQRDFLDAADGERTQVFFPESAWWLGFDNNVPLVNPITGASRAYDIIEALPEWEIDGHVTFTTGREWTYWQYDHYLTQVTWSGDLTWDQYLEWIAPIYGEYGEQVSALIRAWTELQWRHIYEERPEIYFYLAGELPQDELGEQAGVIARPPKRSYLHILEMSDDQFETWRRDEFALLQTMRDAYQELLMPLSPPDLNELGLYAEVYVGYELFVERIKHAIALYSGVIAARAGDRSEAERQLQVAVDLGARALEKVKVIEEMYRYPIELLTALNPESLTAYPFGYLHETSTGYFWKRREEQLAQLISDVFDAPPEEWGAEVEGALFVGQGVDVSLITPSSPVLQGALGGFIPRLLVRRSPLGESEISDRAQGQPELSAFVVGQDYNQNDRPDPETALRVLSRPITASSSGETEGPSLGWSGDVEVYPLLVRDASGVEVGRLSLYEVTLSFESDPRDQASDPLRLNALWISGEVTPDEVISLVTSVAGIEPAALGQLIKNIWGIPPTDPLPNRLPLLVRAPLNVEMDE